MKLKRLGVALIAALALSAVVASAANATVWTNASKFTSGQSETVTCSKGANGKTGEEANLKLTGKVLTAELELTATGIECVETKITQNGTGAAGIAEDSGKLKFTGVSVMKPAGCKTPATNTTEVLKSKLVHHAAPETTPLFDEFAPNNANNIFTKIVLEGCAAEGTYKVLGNIFGRVNNTSVMAIEQPVKFSAAEQTTMGGTLKVGSEPANLTGEVINKLTSGASWGASES